VKPKVVKAWACGVCRSLHPRIDRTTVEGRKADDWHKARAAACCLCACGRPSGFTGSGATCRLCSAQKTYASAAEHLQRAQQSMDEARERLKRAGGEPK
jgi:hypothetical protein